MIDHRSYAHNLSSFEIKAFTFYGYITNSQTDQLPGDLIVQLVEHCTGIAEVMGSKFRSGLNFFQVVSSQLLKLCV